MSTEQITIVACPVCEQFHKKDYQGECRNNAERFTGIKDAAKKLGTREDNILKLNSDYTEEIQEMSVGQINYTDFFGDEDDPTSDWSLANEHATFKHTGACEFIFYVGDKDDDEDAHQFYIDKFEKAGFSETFIKVVKEGQSDGFNYLNFYA